ncbi:MAG: adenylyltransferase/cytidyltransferase family protein [Clostridiales bacterium]|nr:adenylyltransferase/cytidyltransferase family protein [Clostridiales bacterium]
MIRIRIRKLTEDGNKPYRIGYVPGVFDLLHSGHINLIRRCKERCRYLIVGVLTDDLVEYYKNKRPVMPLEERRAVLEALSYVDETVAVDMSNTDKLDAWEQLHYDCHFSGDDHVGHWNDVLTELRKRGSNMEFFPYTEGISSTAIKEKMKGDKE